MNKLITYVFACGFFALGCQTKTKSNEKEKVIDPVVELPERPNILWLVAEDMGPYIP